jgi:DNA-directed RNA polymerase specialized sigma24 family protein
VEEQIEALTQADHLRFCSVARLEMRGTSYTTPEELVLLAVQDPWLAARGEGGRRWPPHVPFPAYVIMTIRGMCLDSRRQLKRAAAGKVIWEGGDHEEPDVAAQVERGDQARIDLEALLTHFENDSDVRWLIRAERDGLSPAEVKDGSGMTETDYNTARRRLRRGIQKLLPERVEVTRRRWRTGRRK